jgi:hypothetical protein
LLEAFDLVFLNHPLLIPASPAHSREFDTCQLTAMDEPYDRIPPDAEFPGSFFNAQQHSHSMV